MADDKPRNLPVVVPAENGRPRWKRKVIRYSWEVVLEICDRHASGETLTAICRDEHMPSNYSLYEWELEHPEFKTHLDRARELFVNVISDERHEIADNINLREVREITHDSKNGVKIKITHHDQVERDKLRVYVRDKTLSAYLNVPGRKDDPPGGEQALPGLSVTVNNGWDTDE